MDCKIDACFEACVVDCVLNTTVNGVYEADGVANNVDEEDNTVGGGVEMLPLLTLVVAVPVPLLLLLFTSCVLDNGLCWLLSAIAPPTLVL